MVQLPSPQEINELKKFDKPFCLTIYAPHLEFDPTGATNPNQIELKNMIAKSEETLRSSGVDEREVRKTVRPIRSLLDSSELRSPRPESLVVFAHPEMFRYYFLPENTPPAVSVGRGFNLEPMLKMIENNQPYLVLALSHKKVRIYQGDRFQIRELKMKNFPDNMEEALNIDEFPDWLGTHQVAPADRGKLAEDFHGQYNVSETDKQMLFMFFRKIDGSLRKFLQRKDMPLILAGVDYLLPIYRRANTSPYLVKNGLTGNYEHAKLEILRREALDLLARQGRGD